MEVVAIDCEMVGVVGGSQAARVSLVNSSGNCILDEYINPEKPVTDYRTAISGITADTLRRQGRPLHQVKREVEMKLQGRTVVGHSVDKDLEALGLSCSSMRVKDIAQYRGFQQNGQLMSLKDLAKEYLGRYIQTGAHNSKEDAKAAMDLYKIAVNKGWSQ